MTPIQTGIIIAFVGWFLGVLTTSLISIYKSGRVEKKAVYALETDCEKRRAACCVPSLKRDLGRLDIRVTETEKQLDLGRADFKELRGDISDIKEGMAGLKSIVENKIETIILKSKG